MKRMRLKACPFCGGEAEMNVTEDGVCAFCPKCGVQTERLTDISAVCADAVREVARTWNCRAGEDAQDGDE